MPIQRVAVCLILALSLHAAAGAWWLRPSARSGSGLSGYPIAPITLVSIQAREAPTETAAAARMNAPEPAPAGRRAPAPVKLDASAPERQTPPATPHDRPRSDADAVGSSVDFEPASLAGEPLINLSEDDAQVDGRVTIRLSIDETGHVVEAKTLSREGLTDSAANLFLRSFASYEYVPAQRAGQAVKSDVTLVVGVRDGKTGAEPGRR